MHKMRKILYFVASICRLPFVSASSPLRLRFVSASASLWFSFSLFFFLAFLFHRVFVLVFGFSILVLNILKLLLERVGGREGQLRGAGGVACTCVLSHDCHRCRRLFFLLSLSVSLSYLSVYPKFKSISKYDSPLP